MITVRFSWSKFLLTMCICVLLRASQTDGAGESRIYDIRDFGAVGDGEHHDTESINRTISTCAAAGGGEVRFPPGRYLSGTIALKSNVALVFSAAATLIGTDDLTQYQHYRPPQDTQEAKFRPQWHRGLLLGIGVENVSIVGEGVIDGAQVFDAQGEERMRGPHALLLGDCQNVVIRGLSFRDAANYAVMLEHCHDVDIRHIKITGGWDAVHFRGWAGRPCRNICIAACQFSTGDDCIAGRYWQNVLIQNCVINSSCNGIRLIGPAEHVIVHDCLFYGPGRHEHRTTKRDNMLAGILLQPGAWDPSDGHLDDVLISDNTMRNVATPLQVTLSAGNTAGEIIVERLSASGVYRAASSVESWSNVPIERFVMRDASIAYAGGGRRMGGAGDVAQPGLDARRLPAWGFFARQVKDVVLSDVRLSVTKPDERHVLIFDTVDTLKADNLRFPVAPQAAEPIVLRNVKEISLHDLPEDYQQLAPSSSRALSPHNVAADH